MKAKKLLLALASIALLGGCTSSSDPTGGSGNREGYNGYTYENPESEDWDVMPQAPEGITVDGLADEAVYNDSVDLSFSYTSLTKEEQSMDLKVVFLEEGILFHAYRNDSRIYCDPHEDISMTAQDSIELYIDPIISDVVTKDFLQIRYAPSGRYETWIGSQPPNSFYHWTPHFVPVRYGQKVNGTIIDGYDTDTDSNHNSVGVDYEIYVPNSSLGLSASPEKVKILMATVDGCGVGTSSYAWRSYNMVDNPEAEGYITFNNPNYQSEQDPASLENTGWNRSGKIDTASWPTGFGERVLVEVDSKRSLRTASWRLHYKDMDGQPLQLTKNKVVHEVSTFLDLNDTRLSPGDTSPASYPGEEDLFNYIKDETDFEIAWNNKGDYKVYNFPGNVRTRYNEPVEVRTEVKGNTMTLSVDIVDLGHDVAEAYGFSFEYSNAELNEEVMPAITFDYVNDGQSARALNVCQYVRIDATGRTYFHPNNDRVNHKQVVQVGTQATLPQYGSRTFNVAMTYFADGVSLTFATNDGQSFHKDHLFNMEVHVDVMDLVTDQPVNWWVIMNWSNPVCNAELFHDDRPGYSARIKSYHGQYAVNQYCMFIPYADLTDANGNPSSAATLRIQMATAAYQWDHLNEWNPNNEQYCWWNGTGMMSYKGRTDGKGVENNYVAYSERYGEGISFPCNTSGIPLIDLQDDALTFYKKPTTFGEKVKVGDGTVSEPVTRITLKDFTSKGATPTTYGQPTNAELGKAFESFCDDMDFANVSAADKAMLQLTMNGLKTNQKNAILWREVPVNSTYGGGLFATGEQILTKLGITL